ncbi:MAG: class I SAM-dependent methyltransferase [Acidobacteria bacterium]|nr:class I SAM-dependent methyltransferase [Acidobacteriota bacterium]
MAREGRFYTPKFYRDLTATGTSAREVLPLVIEMLSPASIVDVGCGAGHWLAVATELGVRDILGVDGEWVLKTPLVLPRDKLLVHDLRQPLSFGRTFDLAFSLEVGEHLPAARAPSFVEMLCSVSDRVVFSAAIPGQGGRHHVNEQWPAYWARLFSQFGFDCHDVLRPRVWNNSRVLWYYAQNCLIFARAGTAKHLGMPAEPLSLVHPLLWSRRIADLASPGKLLERLPKAFMSAIRGARSS